MTHSKRNSKRGNEYKFLGTTFYISTNDLVKAIRQSRRLHSRLVSELMRQAERHAQQLTTTQLRKRKEVEMAVRAGTVGVEVYGRSG